MDVKKAFAFGFLALAVLTFVAPAGAWFGPFGGCGFGLGFPCCHISMHGIFGCPVRVPVPVPVPVAAPVAAPVPAPVPVAVPACAPGPCGLGAPGYGAGGYGLGWGNNPAIPGPA